jgi:hypothetical protein
MKFLGVAAVAASILSGVDALPRGRTVIVRPSDFEIAVLGGMTLRIDQVENKNFIAQGRGPRALARAFSKYGVAVPVELLLILREILQELGIIPEDGAAPNGIGGAGRGSGRGGRNSTMTPPMNQNLTGSATQGK